MLQSLNIHSGGRGNNSGKAVKQQWYFPIFAPQDEDSMTFLLSLTYYDICV